LKLVTNFAYKFNLFRYIAVRSKQHILKMGGLDYGYSCRGDPGIGFDWEFSLRNWVKGYSVAIFDMGNTRQQGAAGSGGRLYKLNPVDPSIA
jgi:hypothetical protein